MHSLSGYLFLSFIVAFFMTFVVVMFTNQLPQVFHRILERYPFLALLWNMFLSGLLSMVMGQSSMAGFANILSSFLFVVYWNYLRPADGASTRTKTFTNVRNKWNSLLNTLNNGSDTRTSTEEPEEYTEMPLDHEDEGNISEMERTVRFLDLERLKKRQDKIEKELRRNKRSG